MKREDDGRDPHCITDRTNRGPLLSNRTGAAALENSSQNFVGFSCLPQPIQRTTVTNFSVD